jgi:HEAT repeat protein
MNKKLEKIRILNKKLNIIKIQLLKYADDREKLVRSDALDVLSNFYDAKIDETILNKLDDKEYLVKISALEAIILPQNNNKVFNKIAKLLDDKNWLVRAYAIEALADNNAKKYHSKIQTILKYNQNDELLVRIYYGLIKFGEEKYLKKLIKMLKHDNYRVRCAVANALYYLDDIKNHKLIIKKLQKALKKETTKAAKSCISGTILDLGHMRLRGRVTTTT